MWLRSYRSRGDARLIYPPLCFTALNVMSPVCFLPPSEAESGIAILCASPWSHSRSLSALLSVTVRGQSILYGFAKTCGDTSFPRRLASGCMLCQQIEKPADANKTNSAWRCRYQWNGSYFNCIKIMFHNVFISGNSRFGTISDLCKERFLHCLTNIKTPSCIT